jgi:1,4-alpha-glucan branching enzyme
VPALHELDVQSEGFRWISCDDSANSVYAWLRLGRNPRDFLIVAMNCTPVPRDEYRLGVPTTGYFVELFNSDAGIYGGSNLGNLGGVYSESVPLHGQPYSLRICLPPLSLLVLRPVPSRTS